MKKYIIFLLLVFVFINIKGQIQRDYVRPITASPTVAELAKYGNVPVSISTGTANISVPIYTLQCGPLSIPVSLSYNASGIKVNQTASNVGLGWSLNAGGIISADIVGHSDMTTQKRIIKNINDILNSNYPEMADLNLITSIVANSDTLHPQINNYVDSQPDMFTYNFQGYSGNFVLDQDFKVYILNDSRDLSIIPDRVNNTFTITDNRGIIYEFKMYEKTRIKTHYRYFDLNSLSTNGPKMPDQFKVNVTGYFLTKMTSPDGKHWINFGYRAEVNSQKTPVTATLYYAGGTGATALMPDQASFSEVTNWTQQLSSITTSDGYKIEFTSNLSRQDVNGSQSAITGILLLNPNNTINRSWTLDYSYFNASVTSSTEPYLNKRLKLNYVKNNEENTFHRFSYFENTNMPHRNVYGGQDRFGYYNNSSTGQLRMIFPNINTIIKLPQEYKPGVPKEWLVPEMGALEEMLLYFNNGSNQEVNPDYTNTYSLKQISYPTGGFSSFTYEPNTYSYFSKGMTDTDNYWGGLRIKSVTHFSEAGNLASHKQYSYTCTMRKGFSSGTVSAEPKYWSIKRVNGGNKWLGDKMLLNSVPNNSIYSVNGDNIVYKNVTESDGNGFIMHAFTSFYDNPSLFDGLQAYLYYTNNTNVGSFYLASRPSMDFSKEYSGKHYLRGKEYYTEFLNNSGQVVKATRYTYTDDESHKVYGMGAVKSNPWIGGASNDYDLYIYYHPIGRALLTSQTEQLYQGNNYVSTQISYEYNTKNLIKKATTINSKGNQIITQTRYPDDINSGVYSEMVSKWMYNYPIEESVTQNNSTSAVLNTYKKENSIYNISKILTLNKTGAVSFFNGSTYDPAYREEVEYTKYDTYGNITEVKTKDGLYTTILWSYKGRYPVAEIMNATYNEIKTGIGETFITNLLNKDAPVASDYTTIQSLNQTAKFQLSMYEYRPLIGISKITGANEVPVYYHYSSALRLSEIRNNRSQKVTSYNYNYVNQTLDPSGGLEMSLVLPALEQYGVLDDVNFFVLVQGASSGNYTYTWTLKNSGGQVLASSSKEEFSVRIPTAGNLTISCSVRDNSTGTTKSVSKTFVAYYRPLEIYLNTEDEYYSDSFEDFTVSTNGGSGNYSYSWTLRNTSSVIGTGTQKTFRAEFPIRQTGAHTLSCVVTDLTTGSQKTVTNNLNLVLRPLAGKIEGSSQCEVSTNYTYTASAEGALGFYSYQWYLKNSSGSIIKQGTGATFNTSYNATGTYTLSCIVKDEGNREQIEVNRTVEVKPYLKFSGLNYGTSHPYRISGNIICPQQMNVEMKIKVSIYSGSANVTLNIGGQTLNYPAGEYTYRGKLPQGTTPFTYTTTCADRTSVYVTIELKKPDGQYPNIGVSTEENPIYKLYSYPSGLSILFNTEEE